PDRGTFSTLSDEQQKNIQAIAGVLRLSRAFRKCGVESCEGLRAEKSTDAVILHVPGLADSVENAARLAAAKHLLDTYIAKPLLLKPAPKRAAAQPEAPAETSAPQPKVVALLQDIERHHEPPASNESPNSNEPPPRAASASAD
ncbi:MAG TPA: hypothetical protein VH022_02535, partial [Candidatus Acidoferrum sp.]|nr:hypothetical protein [Candidatus Acidoferrum sp.]